MAGTVYPLTLAAMLKGDVDCDGTVKVLAVTSGYTFDATDEFLSDIAGGVRLGTAQTLGSKTFVAGVFHAGAITYAGVAAAAVIAGIIGYIDSGAEATSRLLWIDDTNADGSPLAFTAPGSGIPMSWPNGRCFSI